MNIIIVHNGHIEKVFSSEPQDFVVIESGVYRDIKLREISSLPVRQAEKEAEVDLGCGVIAEREGVYVSSGCNGYYVGLEHGDREACMGDGVALFTFGDKDVLPGTLLFQAMMQHLLKNPDIREAYAL